MNIITQNKDIKNLKGEKNFCRKSCETLQIFLQSDRNDYIYVT